MNDEEKLRQEQQAKALMLKHITDADTDEKKVQVLIDYFKDGYANGMKAGVKQTVFLFKQQIDGMVQGIVEQEKKEQVGANDAS